MKNLKTLTMSLVVMGTIVGSLFNSSKTEAAHPWEFWGEKKVVPCNFVPIEDITTIGTPIGGGIKIVFGDPIRGDEVTCVGFSGKCAGTACVVKG